MPEKTRDTPEERAVAQIMTRYTEYQEAVKDAKEEKHHVKERAYTAMAAACADLLRFYFWEKGDIQRADIWMNRSRRLGARAVQVNKTRLKNLGATMS